MGTIDVIAKWDLKRNEWINNPNKNDYGRSYAIADYKKIINNEFGTKDYIIIAQGSRVEDHSKDYVNIKEKEVRIDHIINYYSKKNDNYIIKLFLMDADAPILEDAKIFANYIDFLANLKDTNTINIIGLSKCSIMCFYIPRFFNCSKSFTKTNIYNIASPYTGTKLASPLIFYPEIKNLITSKIGENKLADTIYNKLIQFYESISSNSHMDYDIAIPNGVPTSKLSVYDENFIKNVFSYDNIEAIKKINSFKNMITGIDQDTLKEAIKTMNFTGIGLCMLDKFFFDNKSDGMVYTESQKKVENYLNIKSYILRSTHHDVNSNIRAINDVLNIVDNTIGETKEKQLYLKK